VTYERQIEQHLSGLSLPEGCLFSSEDLKALLPGLCPMAFKSVMHRLCKIGCFERLCKNLFLKPHPRGQAHQLLFKAANKLRDEHFNYLSFETVLSREGMISQVPMQWISLMTTGRSYTFKIKNYGTIEFIHTKRTANQLLDEIHYDPSIGHWIASPGLAMQDMKNSKRDFALVDEHEPV
jgi:predicted transcriptional regulator of viral defense system